MSKKRWHCRECQSEYESVTFSPWNSPEVKNLNYKTQAYQTIIKYYRKNSCRGNYMRKYGIHLHTSDFFLKYIRYVCKNIFLPLKSKLCFILLLEYSSHYISSHPYKCSTFLRLFDV